ncbi:MAG: helix-turn-helix domain containing protein, partial [Anaerolineae bacterium]|nr:helix-turn-helix domain containing protein [Anaerolineae bacterium]
MVRGQRTLLPPEDEERLKIIAETASPTLRQRALAILAWHDGVTAAEAAKRTDLSVNQVQYLWRQYRQKGLDLFMVEDDAPAQPQAVSVPAPAADDRIGLEALCQQYHVDMAHARYIGSLATQIFDATQTVHRLAPNMRPLLEAAA